MKRGAILGACGIVFLSSLVFAGTSVREPVVAGSFYPSHPKDLSGMIDGFLSNVSPQKSSGELFGLIVPHAGIVYSGQVAAYGYNLLRGEKVETVILIGASHRIPFRGVSIWRDGLWKTPLGNIEVDAPLAAAIASENPLLQAGPEAQLPEHALEVQLPFLQKVLPGVKIVPILFGDQSKDSISALADALTKHFEDKKILVIASTDMSHYYPADVAEKMDLSTIDILKAMDPDKLLNGILGDKNELCGFPAVLTLLQVANRLGYRGINLLKYAHSGDVTGDRNQVVGYSAWAITRGIQEGTLAGGSGEAEKESIREVGPEQQKELLKIAREAIESKVATWPLSDRKGDSPILKSNGAAFVTLKKNGQLRGCVGHLMAFEPLALSVQHNAMAAATQDTRFSPVKAEELKDLRIEISVLSESRKIKNVEEIELGKHGVIVGQGLFHRGVFLPQVATETGWSKEEFLSELCSQKAGLPDDCWKDPKNTLEVFTVQEFSEPAS